MSSAVDTQSSAPASSVAPTSSPGTSPSSSSNSPNTSTDDLSTNSPETTSSAQPTTTTNAPTTTNTPVTSTTPAASPQSTAAGQTTTAGAGTTAAASASASAASTSNVAVVTTSTSSFTSQVATTLYSTDAAGSVVYVTTSVPEVFTTSITTSTSTSSGSSHTGVIVGAVVGGVAGITILALLLFCIRKRVRKDEFDGNFDPDHVVGRSDGGTLPHVDLADEVTPFPQPYPDQGSSSMRQYGQSAYIGVPSSPATSGQTSSDLYSSVDAQSRHLMYHGVPPAGTYPSPAHRYGSSGEWHNSRPGASPPPSMSSYSASSARGTKEHEALGRGQGQTLGLATQLEAAEGNEEVVVHRDGGRAPTEEHAPPKEIPPAYESIPQD